MVDMFLQPIIEKLIEKIDEEIISAAFRYVKDQVRWKKHTKEELDKLNGILPQIEAVVHFASSREQITEEYPALNKWLWQLRDAIDDAKDVLDDLEYMELEKQVTKNKKLRRDEKQLNKNKMLRRVRSIMKSMKKRCVKIGKRALKINPALERLQEAVKKLVQVSTIGVETFIGLVKHVKQELRLELHETRETGSFPKNDLIGRGKEKELVMKWLRNPSNEHQGTDLYENISLLSMVGHGGMGKTTLLQHVYKDEEITMDFDLKMWVCVSDNFDVKKVITDMLESLKKERPRLDTLDALQTALQTEIMSKKLLLVLDDIWEDDEEKDKRKWEDVLAPLASGGFGSKILVTTRTDSVAVMFAKVLKKKKEIVKLDGLEEDDCLQLLNSHAFAGVENPFHDDYKKLRFIAGEIVKKLSRSPLAAKVIGGVLNSYDLDERHWRIVLESNLLDQSSITSILTLSYTILPNHLRNCFAICCMFPQDHEYDKDDLVRMWIALGFIHPSQGMTIEDIGGRYFDGLVKKSLFDKVQHNYKEEYYYKMHDLILESASKFFAQECGKLVDDHEKSSLEISATIRHLFVQNAKPNMFKKIEKFKHLHSLFLIFEASNQDFCSALIKIVLASTCLRVLYIYTPTWTIHTDTWTKMEMIPEEIKYLKHLRYLNIKRINLARLPRSLSNLYHLQYIILDQFMGSGDNFLPSDIHNLSNLRYMELSEICIASICGIGKLKSLQELHKFYLRNEDGYRIKELENMNDLWKLGIYRLENVKDAEEACTAKLYAKRRLTNLSLDWYNIDLRSIDLCGSVLDNLQPPECLRNLSIDNYMGARSAVWMNNVNLISNLEKIELQSCCEWETLPPFGQLPFLKSLKLDYMPRVKWLESKFYGNDKCRVFPLLEELHISSLTELEDWFEGGVVAEDGCLFPCLIDLQIRYCPKLKELPSLPPKLKRLSINDVGWKTLNFCTNSNPIPLESLDIYDCRNITHLLLADEIARLAALRYLSITKCPNVISLGEMPISNNCRLMLSNLWISDPLVLLMEPLRSNASLKNLCIQGNDELVSFPNEAEQWFLNVNERPSFSKLRFSSLKSLQSLPSSLESLSSLQILDICDVPMLRELPNLPPSMESLEQLTIYDVPMLRELPNLPPSLKSLTIWGLPMLQELQNLPPSLKFLDIHDVPMLRELPNLPPSLQSLTIIGKCHPELKERYREDGGSDRHKIAHIPDIRIYIDT